MRQAGIPRGQLPQRAARRGSVHVDVVADPRLERGHDERLPVVDETEVRDERRVEHSVDGGAIVGASLGQPADARAPDEAG